MLRNLGIRKIVIGIVIIAAILVFGFLFWRGIGAVGGAEEFPIIWFIWIAAVLGSLVNQTFRKDQPTLSPRLVVGYFVWKCIISAILALVLYMMFIGELISGDIFPKFIHTTVEQGGSYTNMKDFATTIDPESFKDVAKILVWSFIAGYSERFVPNLLARTLSSTPGGQSG